MMAKLVHFLKVDAENLNFCLHPEMVDVRSRYGLNYFKRYVNSISVK